MSGLDSAQLDELEQMISELLGEPWDKGNGRPRELTMREAGIVSCGYVRNNITEEIWAEIFDVDQSTISRHITFLTPLIEQATAELRPSAEEATEVTKGAIALVDGTLWSLLVMERRARIVVWEIQDYRSRVSDHHESIRRHHLRVRAGPGKSARHGQAERIRM